MAVGISSLKKQQGSGDQGIFYPIVFIHLVPGTLVSFPLLDHGKLFFFPAQQGLYIYCSFCLKTDLPICGWLPIVL